VLFDTDVMVWASRGNEKALRQMEAAEQRNISAVTLMELLQGARTKSEMKSIHAMLRAAAFKVVPLSESISARAVALVEDHTLTNGLQVCDALIAATAIEGRLQLTTGNAKHFRTVPKLELNVFRI
jgi:predicted nucleic acid-binding protein